MSDQIFGKVSSDMDPLKKILSKIPGFGGYMERQARRDSDKLLRETVANRFDQLQQRIAGIQRDLVSQGQLKESGDLEAASIKLRTFSDRVRRATRGYSGLFDAVKINEAELAALYQYDATLLGLGDEVGRAIDNVETSVGGDGLPAATRHLIALARQADEAFDKRQEVILGMGQANQ